MVWMCGYTMAASMEEKAVRDAGFSDVGAASRIAWTVQPESVLVEYVGVEVRNQNRWRRWHGGEALSRNGVH